VFESLNISTIDIVKGRCVPSTPGRPRIVKVIGKEVTVAWSQPDRGGTEVTGYCIAYTTADCMAKHVTLEATTTAKLYKNFGHKRSYVFAIAAKSASGFGNFSRLSQEVKIPSETGKIYFHILPNFKRC